jgi:hypothetical protein
MTEALDALARAVKARDPVATRQARPGGDQGQP